MKTVIEFIEFTHKMNDYERCWKMIRIFDDFYKKLDCALKQAPSSYYQSRLECLCESMRERLQKEGGMK